MYASEFFLVVLSSSFHCAVENTLALSIHFWHDARTLDSSRPTKLLLQEGDDRRLFVVKNNERLSSESGQGPAYCTEVFEGSFLLALESPLCSSVVNAITSSCETENTSCEF
jgi:hypothetical protein